ncbi:MAG: hypothetical protein M1354_04030 [Candidatus Marsarchaeota archaeon]|jgi:chromosome segregation ATPase|nr:hypothetical protein [Candidatus Marsarchaeota archaeon]
MMADQPITTSIDSLVKYLREHGEVDTATLALELGISESTVVDWAGILEKAGMVVVLYKVGKMFVQPKTTSSTELLQIEKTAAQTMKLGIQADIESQQQLLDSVRKKLDEYSATVKNIDSIFNDKLKGPKKELAKIDRLDEEVSKRFTWISTEKKALASAEGDLRKEIDQMQAYAASIKDYSLDTSGIRAMLDDAGHKVQDFKRQTAELNEEFEKVVATHRAAMRALQADTFAKLNSARDAIGTEERRISGYERDIGDYKRKASVESRQISRKGQSLLDEMSRISAEANAICDGSLARITEIRQKLKSAKADLGAIATFNDRLNQVSREVADLSVQVGEVDKLLAGSLQELKEKNAREKGAGEKRKVKADHTAQKIRGIRDVTHQLNKKQKDIKKDIEHLSK